MSGPSRLSTAKATESPLVERPPAQVERRARVGLLALVERPALVEPPARVGLQARVGLPPAQVGLLAAAGLPAAVDLPALVGLRSLAEPLRSGARQVPAPRRLRARRAASPQGALRLSVVRSVPAAQSPRLVAHLAPVAARSATWKPAARLAPAAPRRNPRRARLQMPRLPLADAVAIWARLPAATGSPRWRRCWRCSSLLAAAVAGPDPSVRILQAQLRAQSRPQNACRFPQAAYYRPARGKDACC
jgi:hypothetical protein